MKFDYKTEYLRYKRYYRDLSPVLKTPAARAYTMLVLSLLSLSFFGFFAIRPTIKTIVSLNKEITDARYTDKALQEKINQLSDAQEQYTKIQADLPLVLAALPKESSFQSLIKQIETVAYQSGASISGVQFQNVVLYGEELEKKTASPSSGKLSKIPFTITLNGSYKNFSGLLKSLVEIGRIVGVTSVSINSASAFESGNLTITVGASAYYLP